MCEIDWGRLLEYLKVFFSWPPVLAILVFWFVRRFTTQIAELIQKIDGLELPGGSKITLREKEQQQGAAAPPDLEFPGSGEVVGTNTGDGDIKMPAPIVQAHATPEINKTYSQRIAALYPNVDVASIVEFMHRNPGPALDDYVDKVFQLHCERTFNMIFGTQILVLVYLDNPTLTTPSPGASFASLFSRHVELAQGTTRQLNEFLGFLIVGGFIRNVGTGEGPLYEITEAGREFLRHIKRHYPLQWNAKSF